jgi:hypothetical protein
MNGLEWSNRGRRRTQTGRFRSICDRCVAAGRAAISVTSPKAGPILDGYDEGMGHQIGAGRITGRSRIWLFFTRHLRGLQTVLPLGGGGMWSWHTVGTYGTRSCLAT